MNASDQRIAVANLVTYCERMICRGHLPALDETNLRYFVNETCTAFDMAPVQDRARSNHIGEAA
jgi:hypothetical protein